MNPYRLPREIRPLHYDLELEPDLHGATFRGTVDIGVVVSADVDRIVLNADELDIDAVRVDGVAVERYHLEPDTERLVVEHALAAGDSVVSIDFRGVLNDKLRGWYRSTYRDADGVEQVIATTQMQATDCRRAFPCWDEPEAKATFAVTLVVEPHLLAVSNGPEVSREARDDGKHVVRFGVTMPISTYLVAFVVGPLEATAPIEVPLLDGAGTVPLRIIHVPGKGHLTAFGLEVGAFALEWYQRYYGIAYPAAKCDMIALPDFAAGAMENLGCITYRENLLLVDPASSTQSEMQLVADVVTHELAHMWFGDLVTMRWWNGIWLNEAFATFMEIACCDAFRPAWQRWTSFGLERSVAFETDSLASTRSVEFPVEAPADCDGMFDVLTYQKGGALLRMLEQYLGPDAFRAGVRHYLETHRHGNTETSDLWDAIEAVNPAIPVRRLMDSWIWQPGYPLVTARLVRGADGDDLVLNQQRFSFGATAADDTTTWVIPLHVRIGHPGLDVLDAVVEHKVLLDGPELRVPLGRAAANGEPVVVNAGGHGFVRVAYDDELRARLDGEAIATMDVLERYNLVDDTWNAVVAGRLDALGFVSLLAGFRAERDLAVWRAIAVGLRGVGRLVDGEALTAFRALVRDIVLPVLDDLGFDSRPDDDELTPTLRGLLVSMAAVLGADPAVRSRCEQVMADPDGVHPELVAAATNVVAAFGDAATFDRLLASFRTAPTPQDQLRHLYALSEFPDEAAVLRACEFAVSDEVKTQNAPFLLARCIANRDHGAAAWRFVRDRWDELTARFPANLWVRMVDPVKLLTTPAVVADVQAFFATHPIPQAALTLDQVLERQRVNAALRLREEGPLGEALLGGS